MERVTLGRTGLEVSRIALGTWQLGGEWGSFDELQAVDAIRHARDLGINFFDSAHAYGFGASEALLGRALRSELASERDSLVIATKGGLRMAGDSLVRDSSAAWLRRGVEDSLRALGLDYIDLYQVHWPDPKVPLAETAGELQSLVEEGLIRHVGVSNCDVPELAEFARTRPVETLQPAYHLFRREIEADVLPYAREHDIGVLVYGPLAHGLLGGRLNERTRFATTTGVRTARSSRARPTVATWPPFERSSALRSPAVTRSPRSRSPGRWLIRPSTSPSWVPAACPTSPTAPRRPTSSSIEPTSRRSSASWRGPSPSQVPRPRRPDPLRPRCG
jgi:aryl-alcohol dehydrogenase-like predicted oxidoreductase